LDGLRRLLFMGLLPEASAFEQVHSWLHMVEQNPPYTVCYFLLLIKEADALNFLVSIGSGLTDLPEVVEASPEWRFPISKSLFRIII